MRQSEALRDLRLFMTVLQKYRSIAMEELGPRSGDLHLSKELAAEVWPWVFGEKCPLPALLKVINQAETSGTLAPLDYYNMMVILTRFMPEVLVAYNTTRLNQAGLWAIEEAPRDILINGWEPEAQQDGNTP